MTVNAPPTPRTARRAHGPSSDQATRRRLFDAAMRLFTERGYTQVTVRDVCHAARANVAAVNYHFGDKFGLYMEVVRAAINEMRQTTEAAARAGDGLAAEDKLRAYTRVFLHRVAGDSRHGWIHNLMNREMAQPTPALNYIVDEVITPRMQYLGAVVAELLGCAPDDERVVRCVASIQGQCMIYALETLRAHLVPGWRSKPSQIDGLAQHIADFSLAGIRHLTDQPAERKS